LDKYSDKVDFRERKLDLILEENPNYNPCQIRMEEIMSDKPRKYFGPEQPNIYIGCYQSLEKFPKEFFQQFHTVACDEAHLAKAATLTTILKRTFGHAYNRFGVSGTFPSDDTLEILTIQSVLGPNVTKIEASTLVESGTITPMAIKAVILNHANSDISEKLNYIKKMGAGADAFRLEKEIIQSSDKRVEFIKKLVDKCDSNTLLLFHTIEYGTKIYNKLKEDLQNKDIYYIDGEVNNKKREEIKKQMEVTKVEVEYTILNFGDYEVEVESDFKILLSNGKYKLAKDIDSDDDIDDDFIKKFR
jgi:superfamily II DNA or RNA helicase